MKYMLPIHQGTAPAPRSPDQWERLSEDEPGNTVRHRPEGHGNREADNR